MVFWMRGQNWKLIIISTKCHNASRSRIGKLNEVAVNRIPTTDDCRLVLKAGCDHLSEIDFDGLYEAGFSETVCILAHNIGKKISSNFPSPDIQNGRCGCPIIHSYILFQSSCRYRFSGVPLAGRPSRKNYKITLWSLCWR